MKSNYVFLIDVSGSMSSPDKLQLLKDGFKSLVDYLKPSDRIAIVTYAGEAGVLLESTPGTERDKIKNAIDKLGAGGSTAGAEGIITAYEIAQKNFIKGGNNRIILGTDGDFNVGASSADELVKLIEEKRQSGVYITVLGVGAGNLNDAMMEQVADKGNGNYEYIDNIDQLKKVFVYEINKFYTQVKDCKIQVTFNKDLVESYRLIGYENRKMEDKDFSNDSADAGEIGAGQTITAIYEVKLKNNGSSSDFANIDLRYKYPNENQSRLMSHKVTGQPVAFLSASENTRFAAAVAAWGMLLKDSKYKGAITKQMVIDIASGAVSFDPHQYRSEFLNLIRR
jgi:Ca-activated chloride channel family protein